MGLHRFAGYCSPRKRAAIAAALKVAQAEGVSMWKLADAKAPLDRSVNAGLQ
jgi:hypothetical protein